MSFPGQLAAVNRRIRSGLAPAHSQVYMLGDGAAWVLTEESRALSDVVHAIGLQAFVVPSGSSRGIRSQCLFHTSQFVLRHPERIAPAGCRAAVSYFHGWPTPAHPEFQQCFSGLQQSHRQLSAIQVSNARMHQLMLEAGVAPHKVHLIPIGVRLDRLPLRTPATADEARRALGVPDDALVVGSFQKDGNGWGEGLTPKLIKGPDIFLDVVRILRDRVPRLHVLLSGPSRGFVKEGLTRMGVPFIHHMVADYSAMWQLYHATDLTLVTSRDEGGPKAVLESMATGVPLVTTAVGQAADIVRDGANGWMTQIDDTAGLADRAAAVLDGSMTGVDGVLRAARQTAEQHSYMRQLPQWRTFFTGWAHGSGATPPHPHGAATDS